jgi:hypothetical protein
MAVFLVRLAEVETPCDHFRCEHQVTRRRVGVREEVTGPYVID